jgi:hypothetical protein
MESEEPSPSCGLGPEAGLVPIAAAPATRFAAVQLQFRFETGETLRSAVLQAHVAAGVPLPANRHLTLCGSGPWCCTSPPVLSHA